MSTADSRAAKRDYWNSPNAVRIAKAWEWAKAIALTAAVLVAGSLNF